MGQISASSMTVVGAGGGSQSGAFQSSAVAGLSSVDGAGNVAGAVETGVSVSRTSQMFSLSASRSAASSGGAAADERLAAMVLALIQIVLGLGDKDKDKDDNSKLLASLLGLLALSGARQSSSTEFSSMEYMQSSQIVQMSTTTNVSAVQASAYCRGTTAVSPGVPDGGESGGGSLNVVA
jgi:hypothetical protein